MTRGGAGTGQSLEELFDRLGKDRFRRRFRLTGRELAELQMRGLDTIMKHARELLTRRVAPAQPRNDGRQTPWRNHPVFVAQHATATCCRGCIERWHGIPKGHELSRDELGQLLDVIRAWLSRYAED